MAWHAQLKFVMTECSKTQIRMMGLIYETSGSFTKIHISGPALFSGCICTLHDSFKDWKHYFEVSSSDEKLKLSLMFVKLEGLLVIKLSLCFSSLDETSK